MMKLFRNDVAGQATPAAPRDECDCCDEYATLLARMDDVTRYLVRIETRMIKLAEQAGLDVNSVIAPKRKEQS